jgi:23S rRNA G2445 N2-methylase RlmL
MMQKNKKIPSTPKIRYFATVLPGLEHVLADEIAAKIADAAISATARGKVFFKTRLPAEELQCLRSADNLYRFISHFPAGPHKMDLPQLEKRIGEADLSFIERRGISTRFVVNASRSGKHTYSRFDAAEAAMRAIAKRRPDWRRGTADDHNLEFRLDIEGENALFSLRLTDASYRYRGTMRRFAPAALRPTVAHCFVWLSKPEADDVFLDPCCGSGTILCERLAYPAQRITGGDISEEAVRAARQNAPLLESHVHRWDARQLPMDSGSVDKIVSNLPFGMQISVPEQLGAFYRDVMREMDRVLKRRGTAIFLADDETALIRAAEPSGLHLRETVPLSLKGLNPRLFIFTK